MAKKNNKQAPQPTPIEQPSAAPQFSAKPSIIEQYSLVKIGAAIISLIAIVLIIYFALPSATDCSNDRTCFAEKANSCSNVVMTETIGDGTIVKYSAKDCVLTKKIETFASTEPAEVVTFFKGKEMTCKYNMNNFDVNMISGLSIGIDNCEGALKDAIIELRLAQLELEAS